MIISLSVLISGFTFNLIGAYSMNEIFMVDHICITCDRLAELKPVVPHLDCLQLDKFQPDFTHMCCLPPQLLYTYVIFTN